MNMFYRVKNCKLKPEKRLHMFKACQRIRATQKFLKLSFLSKKKKQNNSLYQVYVLYMFCLHLVYTIQFALATAEYLLACLVSKLSLAAADLIFLKICFVLETESPQCPKVRHGCNFLRQDH